MKARSEAILLEGIQTTSAIGADKSPEPGRFAPPEGKPGNPLS